MSQPLSISLAITRLRRSAIMCCWIVGLALLCQTVIWSLATFTQIRFTAVESAAAEPVIIATETAAGNRGRILPPPNASEAASARAKANAPTITFSSYDGLFQGLTNLCGGIGRLAAIVLVVAMGLGVVLGAGVGVPGSERAVVPFMWAVVIAVLVLPLGKSLSLPWEDGALTSYANMVSWVDRMEAARLARESAAAGVDMAGGPSAAVFYGRFLLFPLACVIGTMVVGLRFSIAVEAAVLESESRTIDPALEREASNMAPTSLHGARGASIVSRAMSERTEEEPAPVPRRRRAVIASTLGESTEVSPPKRLI